MEFIHAIVTSKAFGKGEVISIEGKYITVRFQAGTKKFVYPQVFEKFLKFQDESLQGKIDDQLNAKLKEAENKLSEENAKKVAEEEKKLKLMAEVPTTGEMKYTKQGLINAMASGKAFTFHPFYGHRQSKKVTDSCFSNWYNCSFTVNDVIYHTSEQYMMAQKALLFNDTAVFEKIMSEDNPKAYKALGRQVKNFNPVTWDQHKYGIVLEGCKAKFSQDPEFADYLLSTGDEIIVEAAPRDTIWGVGLGKDNEKIQDPSQWRGTNYLGFVLMEVRDYLRENR